MLFGVLDPVNPSKTNQSEYLTFIVGYTFNPPHWELNLHCGPQPPAATMIPHCVTHTHTAGVLALFALACVTTYVSELPRSRR